MGSGTTAIACLRTNRNFIGYEITKEYYDIATERIKNEQSQLSLF
jgi:DNA modification methylase